MGGGKRPDRRGIQSTWFGFSFILFFRLLGASAGLPLSPLASRGGRLGMPAMTVHSFVVGAVGTSETRRQGCAEDCFVLFFCQDSNRVVA